MNRYLLAGAVFATLLGHAGWAEPQRRVVMLRTTATITDAAGERRTQPYWQLELDRESAVELSSEASVAGCEAAFAEGYATCSLGLPRA